jgi:dipeptidyl aminopeptidase/acylaminoacyl peptidase
VVPSIPIAGGEVPSELFSAIPGGVLPALDELIRLGITDEARVGVLGQSFGGYTVNALVAQTDRFAAAISLAGATDLAANAAAFDPSARGWRGLGHDMAFNQGIYETAFNLRVDAGTDPALYHRNSPLTYANQINTPLLLIHGELDSRAPLTQVETLYSLLRRRGRPARLLRYWGENHSLANSPANVRDLTDEVLTWFNTYLLANESPIE